MRARLLRTFSASAARTHYETLGVPPTAPASVIKLAFYDKARQLHPDSAAAGGASSEATVAAFRAVNDAYSTLSDPDARAAYDAELAAGGGVVSGVRGGGVRPPPKPVSLRLRNEGVYAGLPPPDVPNSVWPSAGAPIAGGGGGSGGGGSGGLPPLDALLQDEGVGALPRHRGPAPSGAPAERTREAAAFRVAQLRAMEREAGGRVRSSDSVARLRRAPVEVVEAGGGARMVAAAAGAALLAAVAFWGAR